MAHGAGEGRFVLETETLAPDNPYRQRRGGGSGFGPRIGRTVAARESWTMPVDEIYACVRQLLTVKG